MVVFLKNANPDLWGTGAHGTLIDTYLPLLLYHDLTGTGYNKMEAMLEKGKQRGNIGHHSMDNNSKVLRKALEPWANAQIELGGAGVWNEAQSRCHFPDPFNDTNIWVNVGWQIKHAPNIRYLELQTECTRSTLYASFGRQSQSAQDLRRVHAQAARWQLPRGA